MENAFLHLSDASQQEPQVFTSFLLLSPSNESALAIPDESINMKGRGGGGQTTWPLIGVTRFRFGNNLESHCCATADTPVTTCGHNTRAASPGNRRKAGARRTNEQVSRKKMKRGVKNNITFIQKLSYLHVMDSMYSVGTVCISGNMSIH